MSSRNRVIQVAVLCLAALAPGAARAEDTAAAREHYQKGTAYYDLGRFQDAVKEFEAAYEAKNDPALLYNLAQSHRLAGNSEQALHFYRTYLRRVPKAPNRAEIEGRIMALEKLIDDKKGTQSPPNQTIPPAGGIADATPHTVTPPAPPPTTPVTPSPPPVMPPPGASAPGPFPPATPPPMPMPPPAAGDPGSTKRIVGLVAGGVGVVGIVSGALFGLGAKSAAQEITDAGNQGRAYNAHLHDVDARGRRYQMLEFVSLGIGAVALAGGIYLYYSGSSAPEAAPGGRISLLPSLSPGTATGTLQVTF